MKGYAMLKIGESGWIEKERPVCGLLMRFAALVAVADLFFRMFTPFMVPVAIGRTAHMILGHDAALKL